MSKIILDENAVAPGTPTANTSIIYPKADGLWYCKDDAGAETPLGGLAVASQVQYDLFQAASATTIVRIAGAASAVLVTDGSKVPSLSQTLPAAVQANISGFGAWTTPAFNAGNFTASGSMTWTVESGDVQTYAYTIIGKTMILNFTIVTSTVGGTPDSTLQIAIPASKLAAKTQTGGLTYTDAALRGVGSTTVVAGGSIAYLYTYSWGNWTPSTNTTRVSGSIAFEIQ